MKKLLSILASVSIIASGSSTIMGMNPIPKVNKPENKKINQISTNYLKTIDITKTVNMVVGSISQAIIRNFSNLTNIKVQSINPDIVSVALFDDVIELNGIKTGMTTVKVTADNAEDAFMTVTITELKEIDIDKTADTYSNKTLMVQIRNASELSNIEVKSSNEQIATVSIINDSLEIVGIVEGTTTVIVSADDAKFAIITVTVQKLETIELEGKEAIIVVGNTTRIKINNFEVLESVKVESENSEIADVALVENLIIVKGFRAGNVNVIVSAVNAGNEIISITVNDLMPIEVDKETVEIYGNNSNQVKITNFSNLENVDVNSDDNSVATAVLDLKGVITIYGNKIGITTITINAIDAVEKTISVIVRDLKTIDIDKKTEVYAQETTKMQIRNASELTDIEVKSSNEQIVTALIEDNTNIVITGLRPGQAELIVSASNAQDAIISVTVNDLKTIIVNQKVNIVNGSTNFLPITNFNELENVSVRSLDSKIASVGLMKDSIVILGNGVGTVEVIVSGFHAWDAIISVTVTPLKAIEVDKDKVEVDENGDEKVNITNFQNLKSVLVQSMDTSIATTNLNSQGLITVHGNKVGSTTISITAKDAEKKEISVEVTELDKIIVDRDIVDLYGVQTELVKITNFSDLTNVNVQSNNEKVVEVTNQGNGLVSIIRAVGSNIGDQTTVEITADHHATKTIISVLIKAQTPLNEIIKTLALDSENEDQVIDEIVKKNSGLRKEDIKIKEGSFKAPISEEQKLGEVIIEPNSTKYNGEIKVLLVPQMPHDPKTEELMTKIKNGKDLEERKPYWKEYFEYKGVLFFEELMPKNPWSFSENDFDIDENGNKQLTREAFKLISDYLDAVVQSLMWQDYDKYEIKKDYTKFEYIMSDDYQTTVEGKFVTIQFKGFYSFFLTDNSRLRINFDDDIKGTIID